MIKRIIEISKERTHLSVRHGQLIVRRSEDESVSIPCEDIGLLLVDHCATTYTHAVFTQLLAAGAAIVLSGLDHHPTGLLLPLNANTLQAERHRQQIATKLPLKKRLWQQLVRAKIRHQAAVLGKESAVHQRLLNLAKSVRSGDPDNREAQASRVYWPHFIDGLQFRRLQDGPPPNHLLNYGYTVLRAAIARALAGAGLICSLGLHHQNRYNAFCLADDLLEPFRGFVETRVRDLWETRGPDWCDTLSQPVKAELLDILYQRVTVAGQSGPLMVSLHRTAASLQRCFAGLQQRLDLPS